MMRTIKIQVWGVLPGDTLVEFQNETEDAHLLKIRKVWRESTDSGICIVLTSQSGEVRRFRSNIETVSILSSAP